MNAAPIRMPQPLTENPIHATSNPSASATLGNSSIGLGNRLAQSWGAMLLQAQFRPCPVSPRFSQKRNGDGNGPIHLQFSHLAHPAGHVWRQTLITGPKVEILCCMAFPAEADQAPVFACETIAYHGDLKIAVVDLEPCLPIAQAPTVLPWWSHLMDTMSQAVPNSAMESLAITTQHPDWAHDCFTPRVIHSRPETAKDQTQFQANFAQAATAYLQLWLNWGSPYKSHTPQNPAIHKINIAPRTPNVSQSQSPSGPANLNWEAYRSHHAAHTPGRPFLSAQFGREWTEEFLTTVMYG